MVADFDSFLRNNNAPWILSENLSFWGEKWIPFNILKRQEKKNCERKLLCLAFGKKGDIILQFRD